MQEGPLAQAPPLLPGKDFLQGLDMIVDLSYLGSLLRLLGLFFKQDLCFSPFFRLRPLMGALQFL